MIGVSPLLELFQTGAAAYVSPEAPSYLGRADEVTHAFCRATSPRGHRNIRLPGGGDRNHVLNANCIFTALVLIPALGPLCCLERDCGALHGRREKLDAVVQTGFSLWETGARMGGAPKIAKVPMRNSFCIEVGQPGDGEPPQRCLA